MNHSTCGTIFVRFSAFMPWKMLFGYCSHFHFHSAFLHSLFKGIPARRIVHPRKWERKSLKYLCSQKNETFKSCALFSKSLKTDTELLYKEIICCVNFAKLDNFWKGIFALWKMHSDIWISWYEWHSYRNQNFIFTSNLTAFTIPIRDEDSWDINFEIVALIYV